MAPSVDPEVTQPLRSRIPGIGFGLQDGAIVLNGEPFAIKAGYEARFIEALCRAGGYLSDRRLIRRVYRDDSLENYEARGRDVVLRQLVSPLKKTIRANYALDSDELVGTDSGGFGLRLDPACIGSSARPVTYEDGPALVELEDKDEVWDRAHRVVVLRNRWEGWLPTQVRFPVDKTPFPMPAEWQSEFEAFRTELRRRQPGDDGEKFMLTDVPRPSTDGGAELIIPLRPARWSETCFFSDEVARDGWRAEPLLSLVEGRTREIRAAQSLSLHLAVVTSDGEALLVRQGDPDKHFYPDHWSCTIEEQLSPADVKLPRREVMAWCERALDEELGLTVDLAGGPLFDPEDLRVLDLVLLEDTLGFAVVAVVRLKMSASEFRAIAPRAFANRRDREWTGEWKLLNQSLLIQEFAEPTLRPYHPTSRYRMKLALMRLDTHRDLFKEVAHLQPAPRYARRKK